ncbi:MAG: acetyl-CoA carboxylase carboxyltransferase subunit alpha [Bacteroidetes bacterium]|jgi:acetyl-CoA carboxylase carboxyl transferase subunit alpha|nr:acetyl-CoA carboxylase carboxyltransferase subunit alpha [Balneolaceae bacterium]MBL6916947.1 acetyl-CoA carboxylase carboxyltransferase subunit alpha [Balneolaceae bacterium]MDA0736143.1 acetyl-CoA carboxylase carboxyltransferase subunit alpha [Bacteroidota bacterium]MDA1126730.1 acetyl-CoA carboxylase carboxyltransferase subunit alpha [Bacteroidota bacterium]CAI8390115.1 MAG: Acetyl-coenzyme A carboxylase carboxyl transferase subunit alpha [Rhodothermaeota bacterium MED-G12]
MQYLEFEQPIADLEKKIQELEQLSSSSEGVLSKEVESLKTKVESLQKNIFENLTRWQRVQLARHPERPYTLDYIERICDRFIELHGDRFHADDKAIVGGLGEVDGQTVCIIGHQKGRDTASRTYRNFGMANPEGYRKAYRLMEMAEKFGIPVVTLVDTPGAFPGLEAEERGQAEAIARNLKRMAMLKVPIVTIIIGEGASGGAIGIGMGNEVFMMENTWYSVISPESCSSILWKTWDYKEQAASALKLTAPDLLEMGIIDGVIKEPLAGAHRDYDAAANAVKKQVLNSLSSLSKQNPEKLIEQRIAKYSAMGRYK